MRVFVLAIAMALAACSPKAPAPANGNATTTTTQSADQSRAKPGPDPAAQTAPLPVIDRAFLVGRWGDNGDCTKDVVLNADGSFHSYTGGEGEWSLNGVTMRMAGKTSTQDLQLQWIDQNTIQVTNPDGSVGRSQRC